jgi:sugar phosphate isomerase/epimerase
MRLGSDALKFPGAADSSPTELLDKAHAEGLAGLFFRTMMQISPDLDPARLKEVRERADELGLYLEAGIGLVNPYAIAEDPRLRTLGEGDTLLGFRRIMESAAAIGITELWAETAGFKPYSGRFHYDRFRTDVSWTDQLAAIDKFLHLLAPIARDLGIHINLETHEEITSFELVRLIESVGPDVTGITFDTANVLQRAEHPVWCARRIAPYVRQTHIKDAGLFHVPGGLAYQMRPNGQGVVELDRILPILVQHNPDLNLSIEAREVMPGRPHRREDVKPHLISLYEQEWIAAHPDLTPGELLAFVQLVEAYAERVRAGQVEAHDTYAVRPFGLAEHWDYLRTCVAAVRQSAAAAGLSLGNPPT